MSGQDMEDINYGDESHHDIISMKILEDICDGSQTNPNVNRREARYKIRDRIRQRKPEWKGALKATQITGKGLHKVFSTVVKDIFAKFTPLGESGSEVSHFIPKPRNFSEVKKLSENMLKENIKDIKNPINNQTLLIEDQNEGEPVTPCMDVYKAKIQYDGSLDKLKLRIVVRGDMQNK